MADVFRIRHNDNSLASYGFQTLDSGKLSLSTAAALEGSHGVQIVIDNTNDKEVGLTMTKQTITRVGFRFNPNGITMANNDAFELSKLIQGSGSFATIFTMQWRFISSAYNLRLIALNDAGTSVLDSVMTPAPSVPFTVEVKCTQAATSVSSDGAYEWFVHGLSKGSVSGVDNFNRMSDPTNWRAYMRAGNTIDAGTTGTIYFDEFAGNNDGNPLFPNPGIWFM